MKRHWYTQHLVDAGQLYRADLGPNAGSFHSYNSETKEEFRERVERLAILTPKHMIKIVEL